MEKLTQSQGQGERSWGPGWRQEALRLLVLVQVRGHKRPRCGSEGSSGILVMARVLTAASFLSPALPFPARRLCEEEKLTYLVSWRHLSLWNPSSWSRESVHLSWEGRKRWTFRWFVPVFVNHCARHSNLFKFFCYCCWRKLADALYFIAFGAIITGSDACTSSMLFSW